MLERYAYDAKGNKIPFVVRKQQPYTLYNGITSVGEVEYLPTYEDNPELECSYVWPIEEFFARWEVNTEDQERLRELNPHGIIEGEGPYGFDFETRTVKAELKTSDDE